MRTEQWSLGVYIERHGFRVRCIRENWVFGKLIPMYVEHGFHTSREGIRCIDSAPGFRVCITPVYRARLHLLLDSKNIMFWKFGSWLLLFKHHVLQCLDTMNGNGRSFHAIQGNVRLV